MTNPTPHSMTKCEEKAPAQILAQTSNYSTFSSMPPTANGSQNIPNVDLILQNPSNVELVQQRKQQNRSPTTNKTSNAAGNSFVAGSCAPQSELAKEQLKDKSNKRKSLLNTYSSEELLLQAASSLQGLEGNQFNLVKLSIQTGVM